MAKKKGAAEIIPAILGVAEAVAGGVKGVKDSPAGASQPGAFLKGMSSAVSSTGYKPSSSFDQANTKDRSHADKMFPGSSQNTPFKPFLAGNDPSI